MSASRTPDARDVALRALQRRDLSRRELDTRLARAGVAEPERGETIERLAAAGLVSDARFAHERGRVLATRGLGDDAIRADLRRHGVDRETVEETLAALAPEPERAAAQLARRGGGAAALRFLARKGFRSETLEHLAAVDELD